ncbi:MAG: hypothetical protein D6798_16115 [Deltaproteobacteria bacterium]|nr:MAG: hypothetical protein D6798_16115 [Deltaproteobacteria bacterium]
MNTTSADSYLQHGCGRCERFRTPQCKVHQWTEPLVALRALLLETELREEMKWGSPCYTLDGRNVVMLTAFQDFCCLAFFKGALLTDEDGLLDAPGANSRAVRQLRFTSAEQVHRRQGLVKRLLDEAIALERAGARVPVRESPEPVPVELEEVLDADPRLRAAFDALTPGRRRSFILYVSGAKQATTRTRRAQRCIPKILEGKGFHER